jgi:copper chaperone
MEGSDMSTATYRVSGMTCGHCVSAVIEEIRKLEGVAGVDVDLVAGGESRLTVTSAAPLPEDAVRDAIDEAGYELTTAPG